MPPEQPEPADPTRAGILISLAIGFVGITFGVLARSTGLSVLQACTMSLLVFTGASQFAVVGVLAGGGTLLAGVGAAVLLAVRNTLYGPVVAPALRGPWWTRLLHAHLVIDESAGVAAAQPDLRSARKGFLVTGIGVLVCWTAGTALGALAGDVVGDPERFGLDAAFPAVSLALLAPHLRHVRGRTAALVAAALALLVVPVVPVGVPVLLSVLALVPAVAMPTRVRAVEEDPT
jgi:4-azaleucine resistance transporter AzlC